MAHPVRQAMAAGVAPREKCNLELIGSDVYQRLQHRIEGLNAMTSTDYISDAEIADMRMLWIAAQKCRDVHLAVARTISPEYVGILTREGEAAEAEWAELLTRKITWGEWALRNERRLQQRQKDVAVVLNRLLAQPAQAVAPAPPPRPARAPILNCVSIGGITQCNWI